MTPAELTTWHEHIAQLRSTQLSLMRCAPYRDFGLIPNPGASEQALGEAEERLGHALPQSYRSFLAKHDGWKRLYDGASLLGCGELGSPEHTRIARQIFTSAASPSACSPMSFRCPPRSLLVFGLDRAGTTLFAFDLDSDAGLGDPPVTAWIGELGIRYANFSAFLAGIVGLCEAELQALDAEAPVSSGPRRRAPVALSAAELSEPLRRSA